MIKKLKFLLLLMVFNVGVSYAGDGVEITVEPSSPSEDDEIVVSFDVPYSVLGFIYSGPGDETRVSIDGNSLTVEFESTSCAVCSPAPPYFPWGVNLGQLPEGEYDLTNIILSPVDGAVILELDPFNFTVSRGSIQSVPALSLFSIFVMMFLFLVLYRFHPVKSK